MREISAVDSRSPSVIAGNAKVVKDFADEKSVTEHSRISIDEVLFEAKLQRQKEASEPGPDSSVSWRAVFKTHFLKSNHGKVEITHEDMDEERRKKADVGLSEQSLNESIENSTRVARSLSWISIFFLITTDVLGPFGAPYAVSQLGYVPGSLLFFLFGVVAVYTGLLLWRMFLKLDSEKYPIKNYGDLVGRICGSSARYCVDIFQSIQLMSNVAVIILTNGQSLSQVAKGRGCYTVLIMVWAIAGMILGQIKSLKQFSFLANFSVWLIVFVVIMSMVLVAHLPPNYTAAGGTNGVSPGPVITQAIIYNNGNTKFTDQLTACMNIVFAYGFALVFVEFMAEMKRPWDFWKGMVVSQVFIFVVYLTYGLFMYSQQGQFVINPANQGIPDSQWAWQTVGNVFSMIASLIGAVLYGNIGVKIIYQTFCQRPLRLPSFESKYGRLIWIAAVIIY